MFLVHGLSMGSAGNLQAIVVDCGCLSRQVCITSGSLICIDWQRNEEVQYTPEYKASPEAVIGQCHFGIINQAGVM